MAKDGEQDEGEEKDVTGVTANGKPPREYKANDEVSEEEDEDEEEEPRLKYGTLTKHLSPVYRNGDATSTFMVAGDKMVASAPPRQACQL